MKPPHMVGSRSFSNSFAAGDNSEIGLYDVEMLAGFPGLGKGITLPVFQISGILHDTTIKLNSCAIYSWARLPRCFKCIDAILSGPRAFEFLMSLIAFATSSPFRFGCHFVKDFNFLLSVLDSFGSGFPGGQYCLHNRFAQLLLL